MLMYMMMIDMKTIQWEKTYLVTASSSTSGSTINHLLSSSEEVLSGFQPGSVVLLS
jgi:hypothetical protein